MLAPAVDGFRSHVDFLPLGHGPLDGMTFAVKDLIDLADTVTGCGNPTWAATHPPAGAHAVVVEQLLRSGGRCVGKTITDEFAFSLAGENHFYGTPRNPKAPDRVPGGSSSGSASVVAEGKADFALGTDTAGSIRVPASNCGILGLRPTWGKLSVAGVQPLAPSFDTVGILARDSEVLRRVSRVLMPGDIVNPAIRRVLLLDQAWGIADAEIQALRGAAAERFYGAGLEVESVGLSELVAGEQGRDMLAWSRTFCGVQWPEIWCTYSAWLEAGALQPGPNIAGNFANVKRTNRSQLLSHLECRAHARSSACGALPADTALCIPTASSVAPVRGKVDYDRSGTGYLPRTVALCAISGLCCLPQLSLPFFTEAGLPAGVSLIGGAGNDSALVDLACTLNA